MPLKTQTVEEPALNLTPMIDIVFLLIIFFMVGSEFTKKTAEAEVLLNVQLPTVSDVPGLSRAPDPIVIAVPSEGDMAVRGGPQNAKAKFLNLTQLRDFLVEARRLDAQRKFNNRAVIIRPDGKAATQRTLDAYQSAAHAGFKKVQIAARHAPEDGDRKRR